MLLNILQNKFFAGALRSDFLKFIHFSKSWLNYKNLPYINILPFNTSFSDKFQRERDTKIWISLFPVNSWNQTYDITRFHSISKGNKERESIVSVSPLYNACSFNILIIKYTPFWSSMNELIINEVSRYDSTYIIDVYHIETSTSRIRCWIRDWARPVIECSRRQWISVMMKLWTF